jgi:hypothetical protein
MFPRLTSRIDDYPVKRWRYDNHDRIDPSVRDEVVKVRIIGATVSGRELFAFLTLTATDRGKLGVWNVFNNMPSVAAAMFAGSNESNT